MILHESFHLFLGATVPLSDVHMQGIVTAGPAVSPLSPLLESRHQAHARLGHSVVNCRMCTNTQDY